MNPEKEAVEWLQIGGVGCAALLMVWGAFAGAVPSFAWYPVVGFVTIDRDDAVDAIETMGFADVLLDNSDEFFVHWRGCADGDYRSFSGLATNAKNERVIVQACCGVTRACRVNSRSIK